MKLTPHFDLEEMTASDEAIARGLSNKPSAAHLTNMRFASMGFEWARSILGNRAIVFTSFYRAPAVNSAVGGVPSSGHALGLAGDFRVAGLTPYEVCVALRDSPLVFDQLILETSRKITHLSFDSRFRREVMTQKGGPGTPFLTGIVK